ncbi:MAG: polysaccharide deacetylase family protein [Candidatus Omnitrophica bacterium]|nr:polysaccharide deacetylase family protein [Candidatus Omnitrophota bacterium]
MRLGIRRYKFFVIFGIILLVVAGGLTWAHQQYVVPIIMYHRIDDESKVSSLSVCPENFHRQIEFLKTHSYSVVKLEELPDLMKKKKLPRRTIAITLDDGYENNYTCAYPVFKEFGIPATIFISPALVGTEGYLTWDQIVEMSESGVISIGSHAMTHAWLPDLPEQKLDIEIFDSKRAIEGHLRKKIHSFSYPLGGFNSHVRDKVIKAGYRIAVATNPGKKYPKHDLFAMKRLRISRTSDNLLVFWIEISGLYTWIKEHRDED